MDSERSIGIRRMLRWLLVIPGAMAVTALVHFPLHWFCLQLTWGGGFIQISPEDAVALERALIPLVASFGFIFGGACIAPTRRVIVAILLSVLLLVSVQVLLYWFEQSAAFSRVHVMFTARVLIFQLVGACMGILGIIVKCRADE